MWHVEQMQKGDNDMSLPRFLGKSRTVLKFTNTAMQKCLSTSNLHAILDSNNNEIDKSKEDNSSECSANIEEIESDVNSVEDSILLLQCLMLIALFHEKNHIIVTIIFLYQKAS